MYLAKHDVMIPAMECAPVANTSLRCATYVARTGGMAPKHPTSNLKRTYAKCIAGRFTAGGNTHHIPSS